MQGVDTLKRAFITMISEGIKFIDLPHEAFSGRLYRDSIPDPVADNAEALEQSLKPVL